MADQNLNLTKSEIRELRYLRDTRHPLWGEVPPEKAEPWLQYYIRCSLVEWTGDGYLITDKGRQTIEARP
jgi:hypothetical protein